MSKVSLHLVLNLLEFALQRVLDVSSLHSKHRLKSLFLALKKMDLLLMVAQIVGQSLDGFLLLSHCIPPDSSAWTSDFLGW